VKLRTTITISLLFLLGLRIGLSETNSRSVENQMANTLVLRGRVTSVKTEIPREGNFAIVTINLRIEFTNTGKKPVILLKDLAPLCVGEAITNTPIKPIHWPVPEGDNILYWDYRGPSDFGSGRWEYLRNSLNQANPPLDKVSVLAPGQEWTTESFVILRPKIKPEKSSSPNKPATLNNLEALSPVWLHLYCQTWPPNIEVRGIMDDAKTGHILGKRWMQFGELRLEPITSEPISLEFPKQHAKLDDESGRQ
jgi:hypothetical protein